jgi:hypothetical protein
MVSRVVNAGSKYPPATFSAVKTHAETAPRLRCSLASDPRGSHRTATRDPGRVSFRSSIHFPGNSPERDVNPVMFPPGRAGSRRGRPSRVAGDRHDDEIVLVARLAASGPCARDDDIHLEANKVGGEARSVRPVPPPIGIRC